MGEEPQIDTKVTLILSESDCRRISGYLSIIRYGFQETINMAQSKYDKDVYRKQFDDVDLLIHRVNSSARH